MFFLRRVRTDARRSGSSVRRAATGPVAPDFAFRQKCSILEREEGEEFVRLALTVRTFGRPRTERKTVMQFRYPARLRPDASGEIVVSFRDFPECLTSGADTSEALAEARDALEEAVAGRIAHGESIPAPSRRRAGEHFVTVPPDMAAKAADFLAFRKSGLSRLHLS